MKKFIRIAAVILLSFSAITALSQSRLEFDYLVKDLNQRPKPGVRVTAVETRTFEYLVFHTNSEGVAEIRINSGDEWSLNVGEMRGVETIYMPEEGTKVMGGEVTLDPVMWEMDNSPNGDRSKITFTEMRQKIAVDCTAAPNFCLVSVYFQDRRANPWANLEVSLVNPSQRSTVTTFTDGNGIARMQVPSGSYELDVDGEEGFQRIGVPGDTNAIQFTYVFRRKDFSEEVNEEGNLVQRLNLPQRTVSNRVYVELMVRKEGGNPYQEKVLIRTANSKTIYQGYTDQEGQINFMLPKGHVYSVNFEFQENAATLDLTNRETTGKMKQIVPYIPDPRLAYPERYLPLEEELKFFDLNNVLTEQYADTPDDNIVNFHARWGNNKIGSGAQEAILEMGFSVKSGIKPNPTGKPVNLVFVLDKSGSMSFERIDVLKYAMAKMIEELRPQDKASIVLFDTESALAYPLIQSDENRLKDVVYAIRAGGGTNIFEGLKEGYTVLDKAYDPTAVNRVVLLTDGYGSKPVDEILQLSGSYFRKGMTVSTIGIGQGYNHALLTMISTYSGGLAHQVVESMDLEQAFADEFQSIMYPLASDFKVRITYNDEIIYQNLWGVPSVKEGMGYVNFELPNIFSSMNQTALMKFKLDHPTAAIANKPVVIHVTYFDEQKMQPVEIVKEMRLEWTDETDVELATTEQQKRIYSLAVINQCNKVIADFCENEDYEAAEKEVVVTLKALRKTNNNRFSEDFQPYIKQLEDYLKAIRATIKATPKGDQFTIKME